MVKKAPMVLYFASGVCALIYEIVWMRLLGGMFGVTLHATSAVLAATMGGLALGSHLGGRWLERSGQARRLGLRAYGVLELATGAFALFVPWLVGATLGFYVVLAGWAGGSAAMLLPLRFGLTMILVGIPFALMGATFPAMVCHLADKPAELRRTTALLYGINTMGAVVGALWTGLWLLPQHGVWLSNATAAALSFAVGLGALALARRRANSAPHSGAVDAVPAEAGSSSVAARTAKRAKRRQAARVALLVTFVSGLTALSYELIWFRALELITYDTSTAFTCVLAVFLAGIAIGGVVAGRRTFRRARMAWAALGAFQIVIAVYALLSPHLLRLVDGGFGHDYDRLALAGASPGSFVLKQLVVATLTLIAPTVLLGASLPLAISLYGRATESIAAGTGRVYAANTLGAIVGASISGVVLIPMLGSRVALVLVAMLNVGAGLAALGRSGSEARQLPQRWPALCARVGVPAAVFLAATLVFMGPDVFLQREKVGGRERILRLEDAIGLVEIYRDDTGVLHLTADRVHGWGSTSPAMLRSMRRQGYLPLLLHPQPRSAIEIGLATGIQMVPLTLYAGVERVEVVEISTAIVEAARRFGEYNHGLLDSPKLELVVADGRQHLLTTKRRYDIIVLGLFVPYRRGAEELFSLELYRDCRERLEPGGLVVHWLPLDQLTTAGLRVVMETFRHAFPAMQVWNKAQYLALVGADSELERDLDALIVRVAEPSIRADLERHGLDDPMGWLASYFMDAAAVARFTAGAVVNTRDRPTKELGGVNIFQRGNYRQAIINLEALLPHRAAPRVTSSAASHDALARSFEARGHALRGAVAQARGSHREAIAHLMRAAKLYPDDEIVKSELPKYQNALERLR